MQRCRLYRIHKVHLCEGKCDYRTDRHTHTQTDAGQSDPYVPLCFAGDTKTNADSIIHHIRIARRIGVEVAGWTVDRRSGLDSRLTLSTCGPSDGKEVKDNFGRPGARVEVGSAR